jgi:hypothetical protein
MLSLINASDNLTNSRHTGRRMPDRQDAAKTLTRLKKLSDELDAAKQSAEEAVKDVARAKVTTDGIAKDVRVLDTAETQGQVHAHTPRKKKEATLERRVGGPRLTQIVLPGYRQQGAEAQASDFARDCSRRRLAVHHEDTKHTKDSQGAS